MHSWSADEVADSVLSIYSRLDPHLPEGRWTVLAAVVLSSDEGLKPISLGTGVKCLPADRLSSNGDDLHDSHAEVLARRGATRWFMEEIGRFDSHPGCQWLQRGGDGKLMLSDNVLVHLYVSTIPCKKIHRWTFLHTLTWPLAKAEMPRWGF